MEVKLSSIINVLPTIFGLFGVIYGLFHKSKAMPVWLQRVQALLSTSGVDISAIIENYNDYTAMTAEDKRKLAVEELKHLADKNCIPLDTSTANLLVEWTYNTYKKAIK